jgi:hypothetical protein
MAEEPEDDRGITHAATCHPARLVDTQAATLIPSDHHKRSSWAQFPQAD